MLHELFPNKGAAICRMISAGFMLTLAAAAGAQSRPLSAFDPQVKEVLARMTLEEKVGQMTQPDISALKDPADIENLFLGSLLSGGNADPEAGNKLQAWTEMYEGYQKRALKTRLAIPLLYGIDAVHGNNNVMGATVFPHNIGLGCTRNPELVARAARVTAEEVRATGINWTFAPCVTVPRDERWGRTYEGYSENPDVVKVLGEAAVRGFQGSDLASPLAVLACAKHFIGDGGTAWGTGQNGKGMDQGDTKVDEAALRAIHLPGYLTTVQAGVGTIMPSYSSWNGVKCSANRYLLTDLLKKELGFEGFLISDYNAIDQITKDYKQCIEISINAGMDMVMVTDKYREFIKALTELVKEGKVPMARIDDAVTRILRVKFAMGLMDPARRAALMGNPELQQRFGSEEHRAVAREAVRESLVLLKNENKALPLARTAKRIHVAGKGSDNLGMQCGGWTIDWQGKTGAVTQGTTILSAIRNTAAKETQVTCTADGTGAKGADVGVVVIGEKPYAEMMGDRDNLALDAEDAEAVANMKKAGIPVVVVLLSGRPMILGEVLEQADALVAAWLPGTEGQGVADVLFGNFKPTGKLSFSWPRSMKQIPINVGDKNYDPLFAFGYGLTY